MSKTNRIFVAVGLFILILSAAFGQSPAAAGNALTAMRDGMPAADLLDSRDDCELPHPDIPGSTDSEPIPLIDMPLEPGANYHGYLGGLYPGSTNQMPGAHAQAGLARSMAVQPLDVSGQPAQNGRIVFLSVGMSNTSQEFCGNDGSCVHNSFSSQATSDSDVSDRIVFYNGAGTGQSAEHWLDPAGQNYLEIKSGLQAQGLSVNQVQVIWLKVVNTQQATRPSLPDDGADAVLLLANLGRIVRNLDDHYPNLQQVFVSSRTYGGYSSKPISPEPWAYETGFAMKWLVEAQIRQMATGEVSPCAGDLDYEGAAPWLGWSAYLWADGLQPRSDGLTWAEDDFLSDGIHMSNSGIEKVGGLLLDFFKSSPLTSAWFLGGEVEITPVPTQRSTPRPGPAPTRSP